MESQLEEQSWREQEKVRVREKNKVWEEAVKGTEEPYLKEKPNQSPFFYAQ